MSISRSAYYGRFQRSRLPDLDELEALLKAAAPDIDHADLRDKPYFDRRAETAQGFWDAHKRVWTHRHTQAALNASTAPSDTPTPPSSTPPSTRRGPAGLAHGSTPEKSYLLDPDDGYGNANRIGIPLAQADPIEDLEIHPVIEPKVSVAAPVPLAALPTYVERTHDRELRRIVESAQTRSRAVFLVADSSAGKTRALWESVQRLPSTWRLWRPFNREELVEAIADRRVGPHTVIWLNETQRFLNTAGHAASGERVAVVLMRLLRDARITPILVVGTLWREHATILTAIPAADSEDMHEQARALLNNQVMALPEEFDGEALIAANAVAGTDVRLAEALRRGESRVAQYLAGARELVARYETAPIEVRALIDAAVDLARLGGVERIPEGWLREVGQSYVPSDHWHSQNEAWRDSWFRAALGYAGRPCRGVPGPLTLFRGSTAQAPEYTLADYLRRHLGDARAYAKPPPAFWSAIPKHITGHDSLLFLGTEAGRRGYLRYAETFRTLSFLHPRPDDGFFAGGILQRRLEKGDWANAEPLARVVSVSGDSAAAWSETIDYRARHSSWPGIETMIRYGSRASSADDWRNAVYVAQQSGQAGRAFDVALAAEEAGANIWTALVQDALRDGDLDLAERCAVGAARFQDPSGWLAIARYHREGDRPAEAVPAAEAAARLGHVEELEALARHYAVARKWDDARRVAAAAAGAGSAEGWRHVADAQLACGLIQECETSFDQSIRAGDGSMRVLIARLRLGQHLWSAAARAAKLAIAEGHVSGWAVLALLWDLAGEQDKAHAAAAAAGQVGQWLALASALCADRADRAEHVCHEAANQGNPLLWRVLAQTREIDADQGSASQAWLAAARAGDEVAWANAVSLAFDAGDRVGARAIAQEAWDNGRPEGWLQLVGHTDLAESAEESLHVARTAAAAGVGDVWSRLCQWRIERGDVDGAVLAAEEDDTDECSGWLAVSRFNDDDLERAEAVAGRAAQRGHAGAWAALARAAGGRSDYSLAFRLWRLAAECAEVSGEPYDDEEYDRDGDPAHGAMSHWKSAVRSALRLGDFEAAERIADRVGGRSLWRLVALGYAFEPDPLASGDYFEPDPDRDQRHVQAVRRAIEEGDVSAYERLPSALIRIGELDAAEQASHVAVERMWPAPWSELVTAYESAGRPDDATRVARALKDPDVWETLARRRLDADDPSGAELALDARRALGRFPDYFAPNKSSWSRDSFLPEEFDPSADAFATLARWGIELDGRPASPWSLHEPLAALLCSISRRALARGECSAALEVAREALGLDPASTEAPDLAVLARQDLRRLSEFQDAASRQERDETVGDGGQGSSFVPVRVVRLSIQSGSERSVLLTRNDAPDQLCLRLGGAADPVDRVAESSQIAAFLALMARSQSDRIVRVELVATDVGEVGGRIRLRIGRSVDVRAECALRLAMAIEQEVVATSDLLARARDTQQPRDGDRLRFPDSPDQLEQPQDLTRIVREEVATAWPFEGPTVAVEPTRVFVRSDRTTWLELAAAAGDDGIVCVPVDAPEARDLTQVLSGADPALNPNGLSEITGLLDALGARVRRVTVLRSTNLPMSALVLLSNGVLLNASVSIAVCLARLSGSVVDVSADLLDSGSGSLGEKHDEHPLKIDSGGLNHYSARVALRDGRARGLPVTGLCGWTWIPERVLTPEIPTCPDCLEIYRDSQQMVVDRELAALIATIGRFSRSLEKKRRFSDAVDARRRQRILLRALDAYKPGAFLTATADTAEALAADYEAAGDPAAALKVWREASHIRAGLDAPERELRALKRTVAAARTCVLTDAGRFRGPLAEDLSRMADVLDRLQRYDESVAARFEELEIRRELQDGSVDSLCALALALFRAGRSMEETGRRNAALALSLESVELWRRLLAGDPSTGRADYAIALADVALTLRRLGRTASALLYGEEAVIILRALGANDARERANLAIVLSGHIDDLLATGHDVTALHSLEELVRIRRWQSIEESRPFAEAGDYRLSTTLAEDLDRLGTQLERTQRFEAAADVRVEAVAVRRRMVQESDQAKAALAWTLGNAGFALDAAGRFEAAVATSLEGARLCGELVDSYPDLRDDQAFALHIAASSLVALERETEAEIYHAEAVEIYRDIAEAEPLPCDVDFIGFLDPYARTLIALGKHEQAAEVFGEIVAVRARLVDVDPGTHLTLLAEALADLAGELVALDRFDEAAQVRLDEVDVRRHLLVSNDPDALEELAKSLRDAGWALDRGKRYELSLDAYSESVALSRTLVEVDPRYQGDLAPSLHNVAASLKMLDRVAEAVPIQREALEILRHPSEDSEHSQDDLVLFAALRAYADLLTASERQTQAVDALREAIVVGRRIEAADPNWDARAVLRTIARLGTLTSIDRPDESIASFEELTQSWYAMNRDPSAELQVAWAGVLCSIADDLDQVGDATVPLALYDRAASVVRPLLGIAGAAATLPRFLAGSLRMLERLGRAEHATRLRAEIANIQGEGSEAVDQKGAAPLE